MTYDIDFAGIVSNISYIRWLEDLRNLFAEQALSIGKALQRGMASALMHTEIDYVAPVRFPDMGYLLPWIAFGPSDYQKNIENPGDQRNKISGTGITLTR